VPAARTPSAITNYASSPTADPPILAILVSAITQNLKGNGVKIKFENIFKE